MYMVEEIRIDELDISDSIAESLMENGFVFLHPPQAEAIPIALEGRNIVVAIPTASGKSLIGYIPALKTVVEKHRKVLYIVPLKALASEKKDDFEKFSSLGLKVHQSTGDLDSEDRGLDDADIVVATSEKADSMIRHGNKWIDDLGLVIADEIHMIHDPGRGPTLEVALTKLKRRNPDTQMIALSATISNASDLAEWLDAKLIRSDWRPIPLKEGIFFDGEITFEDRTKKEVPESKDAIWGLVKQAIEDGGQSLIFVNSRRSTESLAVNYSKKMSKYASKTLTPVEKTMLEGNSESTSTGRKLSGCVECGIAFHNAGLTYYQRRFVEDNFKSGSIKCIVATPTLAAGINLPARRVIIRDTSRFESNSGNTPIPVMEVKQMCGRAGRPGYDPYGEAILIAKNEKDFDHLMEDYIEHDTERLTSKLFNDKVLRGHILGLVATGDAHSEDTVIDFLKDTFFGTTSQLFGIESVVERVVDFLVDEGMVERIEDTIRILPYGKRVSDLYIDPISASILKKAVMRVDDNTDPMLILIASAMTPDVLGMYPKKADEELIRQTELNYGESLLVKTDEIEDYYEEFFQSDLKTAILMDQWISETPEDTITETMGIGPGDIKSRVDMMDWIIYSMNEIALIFNPDAVTSIKPLKTRIRYGIKDDLINLVSLRGVGRSRARILYSSGIKSIEDIAQTDESVLAAIPKIGNALAHNLKEQAGHPSMDPIPGMSPSEEESAMLDEMAMMYGEEPATKDKSSEQQKPKQKSLFDF